VPASCSEKVPELWLWRSALGVPLLWPVLAGNLRLRKRAFFAARATLIKSEKRGKLEKCKNK
jgi:hypothetical protein